jgi:hypothetical protein
MNRNSRDVIYVFGSDENRNYLRAELKTFFNNNRVDSFLQRHINDLVDNFIATIEQELELSDPIPGITVADQVHCYNCQFMNDRIGYIRVHVVGDETRARYTVNDGAPTSRFGQKHHAASANRMLETWNMNPARGVQMREDSHGSGANTFTGSGNVMTGVEFCDQSDINTSNHVDQLMSTSYMLALNNDSRNGLAYTNSAFGNATQESDERLMSRRTFRSNESGVENGIPNYRKRIHGRNLDRDIRETLQGVERDCMVHGHDMESMLARVDHKKLVSTMQSAPSHAMVAPMNAKLYNAGTYNRTAQYK